MFCWWAGWLNGFDQTTVFNPRTECVERMFPGAVLVTSFFVPHPAPYANELQDSSRPLIHTPFPSAPPPPPFPATLPPRPPPPALRPTHPPTRQEAPTDRRAHIRRRSPPSQRGRAPSSPTLPRLLPSRSRCHRRRESCNNGGRPGCHNGGGGCPRGW